MTCRSLPGEARSMANHCELWVYGTCVDSDSDIDIVSKVWHPDTPMPT